MSYCRFSYDSFKSDFYVYAACSGGIEIMMAGARWEGETIVDITLPHAGKTFVEPDISAAIIRIKELVKLGYHAPDYLIASLEEDLANPPPWILPLKS